MSLSTHILDTSLGRPVPGVAVTLAHYMESSWQPVYTRRHRCRRALEGRAR